MLLRAKIENILDLYLDVQSEQKLKPWARRLAASIEEILMCAPLAVAQHQRVTTLHPEQRKQFSRLCKALATVSRELESLKKKPALEGELVQLFGEYSEELREIFPIDHDPFAAGERVAYESYRHLTGKLAKATKLFVSPVIDGIPASEFESAPVGAPPKYGPYESIGRLLLFEIIEVLDKQNAKIMRADMANFLTDLLGLIEKCSSHDALLARLTKQYFPSERASAITKAVLTKRKNRKSKTKSKTQANSPVRSKIRR